MLLVTDSIEKRLEVLLEDLEHGMRMSEDCEYAKNAYENLEATVVFAIQDVKNILEKIKYGS